MNQDQVKQALLSLRPGVADFSLIFSGKESSKVNGLYKPETREIIIHNRNFTNDGALMYTAIHEFAHHVHFTKSPVPVTQRAHTTAFRSILHELLGLAEERGMYQNLFLTHPDFVGLTRRLRDEFLKRHGDLMKEMGELLSRAESLCREHHARFEDYVERVLAMDRTTAGALIKIHALDIPSELGYENMRTVAGIANPQKRTEAQDAFLQGESPDMVKQRFKSEGKKTEDPVELLLSERQRIERNIQNLRNRLKEVEDRIEEYRRL